jgi:Domain of unknown function (DUF4504)
VRRAHRRSQRLSLVSLRQRLMLLQHVAIKAAIAAVHTGSKAARKSRAVSDVFVERLADDLMLLTSGLRAAVLCDYYQHGRSPLLAELLSELQASVDQELSCVAVLWLDEACAPFIVHKQLLQQRLASDAGAFPALIDVSCASSTSLGHWNLALVPAMEAVLLELRAATIGICGSTSIAEITFHIPDSDSLNSIGLCGVAGWLLEYPAVYCISSSAVRNRLANVPLAVHDVSFNVQGRQLHAFSFSVPAAAAAAADSSCSVRSELQAHIDSFIAVLAAKVAAQTAPISEQFSGPTVRVHTKVMPMVAL